MNIPQSVPADLHGGTARGLLEFLEYAKSKGELASRTADAYKSACTLVLSIDGERWGDLDVRTLDVDQQMERYIRLKGASAKSASLATYRQRVRAAIKFYGAFLENPLAFRGPTLRRSPTTRRGREPVEGDPEPTSAATESKPSPTSATIATTLITYPFPLRSGEMALLQLPRNLPRSDAKRLAAFLDSIAIDTDDAPPRGGRA